MEYLLFLIGTVLVNNVVLVHFLGLCPFMGVSSKLSPSIGMSVATTLVMTLGGISSWLLEHYVLRPLDIGFLRILAYIVVIASLVQLIELIIRKVSPPLHRALGVYLPLITTNCAVLGVALLNVQQQFNFIESAVYGFGAAVGFSLVLILFSSIRERIAVADVPAPFRGSAIALVTAGLMSLAFMGFSGLIKG